MKINRLTLYLVKRKERRMGMSSELEQNTRSNKKRSKRKSIKWFILIPFFLLIFGGVGYGSFIYNKAKAVVNDAYAKIEKSSKRDKEVEPLKDNISILIMGVDGSEMRKANMAKQFEQMHFISNN